MTNLSSKREYTNNIASYLLELKALSGQALTPDDISNLDDIEIVRLQASKIIEDPVTKFTIPFCEKESDRFRKFVSQMNGVNSCPIYIWTKKTNYCGLFKVRSLMDINFAFPFKINPEGIIVFLSDNFEDKLLLDFTLDSNGNQVLEVERQGKHWPNIKY